MSETASGRPERLFEMADEIIGRRAEIARVIWLVVVAAAALNFVTGVLTSLAWEEFGAIWWMWLLPGLLLLACVFYAIWSYAGDISHRFHFEILLPFRRAAPMVVAGSKIYKPLEKVQQRLREFLQVDHEAAAKVADQWQELIEQDRRAILIEKSPSLLQFVEDLAEFFILDTLVEFGDNSLTAQARFTPMGWARPNYKPMKFGRDQVQESLKGNLLFGHLSQRLPQHLRFLPGFEFRRKPMEDQKKDKAGYLDFISKYGSVRFTMSPFPIIMPSGSRDVKLMSRYCGVLRDDLLVIKIPFHLTVNFRGPRIMRRKFSEKFAPWIEDLVETFRHNLDWQYCSQHDLERMVVELLGREV